MELWKRLRANYEALFRNFFYLNIWLGCFDQVMIVAPYLLAAPLLFEEDASRRITLGTLVQTSNSFGKVFQSLSVVSENWGAINEWRSTLKRLRQFEQRLYGRYYREDVNQSEGKATYESRALLGVRQRPIGARAA